ncbi:S-formylglutathione hydrolase-like [Varroa jacobsoni]|uniref:S-formylglutathione hydrolase n=1 Tax=Varroa destructor TaxID=109461 RepID=A0A7M7KEH1_VARDE|nr:S-formylglutathione hydrolase-like [Varroa destructor]XP_022662204.1 S-formylglutathione hydrolase-like [Varroa destructor]XP_022708065.1 S-formylglutathione hydrolase-like [Varroa jacobsoni]XP_022708066.1 S-formylglutathione hydrolase-like [Varroa jacobsoni]
MSLILVSSNKIFNGFQKVFKHASTTLQKEATFAIYLPEAKSKVPVIYWLSGLTCTEQNFITKAGAQQFAQKYQVAIVCPDTSPRGCNIPGEDDSYDLGTGAGFYVDATQEPWSTNYRMYSYVTKELPGILATSFASEVDASRASIMGHSMGGHGALICTLRNPGRYRSASAFAPICAPSQCPWGQKAFNAYLGSDQASWKAYDATELAKTYTGPNLNILIDQGLDDDFLAKNQLLPEKLQEAASSSDKLKINYRQHAGYDHSYFFIATFIEDHIRLHSEALKE